MVTTRGFQSGAQLVADTYEILLWELRAPTELDLANRVKQVDLTIIPRYPRITGFDFKVVQVLTENPSLNSPIGEVFIDIEGGASQGLQDVLLIGELSPADQPPAPAHRVVRQFDPPVVLRHLDRRLARRVELSATVEEVQGDPVTRSLGGLHSVAWMLERTHRKSRLVHGKRTSMGNSHLNDLEIATFVS